jgi:hypothetical protein
MGLLCRAMRSLIVKDESNMHKTKQIAEIQSGYDVKSLNVYVGDMMYSVSMYIWMM